ncbi:MAG: AraC family transcriptional regulator [Deltaproteobacteria bacterium]|nr:AraC family transcriptional regulator [Deltaproteobacteria bacterium]
MDFRHAQSNSLGRLTEAARINNSQGPADWRKLDKFALVFTLSGTARFRDEFGNDFQMNRGDALLLVPGVSHVYGPLPGHTWNEFYVIFEGPIFDLWHAAGLIDPQTPLYQSPAHHENWLHDLEGARLTDQGRTLDEVCRLQLFLARLLEHRNHGQDADADKVKKACAMLEEDVALPLPSVARRLGYSYESFRKRFRAIMGISPAKYRAARVMDQACELMRRSDQSDKAIASALGFCDEFHFSHRFKAIVGCSPRQFRQRSSRSGTQTAASTKSKMRSP